MVECLFHVAALVCVCIYPPAVSHLPPVFLPKGHVNHGHVYVVTGSWILKQ